ncbi:double-strand break repair helicase AddA [Parasphingopyxis marina]|nr:double-strand break repair helicase AddA [Parasphingopyxis marina]
MKPLYALTSEQRDASAPKELAWLSASAGTGKTQVLTARVMRLLLAGVDPASILCLTFTKAGAAEMADRIHERLAYWVRLKGPKLAQELRALGEPVGEENVEAARRLFAEVLDATGGGLRIQTIHAFCQSLLAAFPAEAGIVPGFQPIEGREQALLLRETMAEMLVAAEERADAGLTADVQQLSRRMGEDGAEKFLERCAGAFQELRALGAPELIGDEMRRALEVPLGDIDAAIAEGCSDAHFDTASLRAFAAANREWGTKTGLKRADTAADWLSRDPAGRAEILGYLRKAWITGAGTFNQTGWAKLCELDADYEATLIRLNEIVGNLLSLRIKGDFADFAAAGLRAGRRFAEAYALAKGRRGVLDFGDMIGRARGLLEQPGIGDWIRYKLDQSIDHILVDEAQDTNAEQWDIVWHLTEEFFETDPESGEAPHRTIFAVGDFKQAIFGFQGTNPRAFRDAQQRFADHIAERLRELRDLSLDKSYRSTPPILELVDAVMADIGAPAIGLDSGIRPHVSGRGDKPGRVTLLRPVTGEEPEDAEEGWAADAKLKMASNLAKQVKRWLDEKLWLGGQGRALRPEDVLILVRSRGELAALLVARLHKEGVPVAGVDRLMLTDPLAVQDLLAALRFALQPEDDLNLASLLVSPLGGWTQDRLYDVAKDRRGSLWSALRDTLNDEDETRAALESILNAADLVTPYQLLESILSGPLRGREKLLSRLGEEARDPIEELLNRALVFEQENSPSLQHFLQWFDTGDAEIKRDPAAPLDAVRVMTVHGAKGLQAPLVILADAAANPEDRPLSEVDFPLGGGSRGVPIPRPRKIEQVGSLAEIVEAKKQADFEEHWRLLYVALTRAEEHLVIGGALGSRAKGVAPEKSWYAAVERALVGLGGDWIEDDLWSGRWDFEGKAPPKAKGGTAARQRFAAPELPAPEWLHGRAPDEQRPPRPLAPSSLGDDRVADPPPDAAMRMAAQRGLLLHSLFERLPDVEPGQRREAARTWLVRVAGIEGAAEREEIADAALAVIDDPAFADLFAPDALAEAPIAAVVGEIVVSGTVDRLLVEEDRVRVIDFKTGRRVPPSIEEAPEAHVKQMAAYAAALGVIFPDRRIEASLLYTSGPLLLTLGEALLEAHKPGLAHEEQSLSPVG